MPFLTNPRREAFAQAYVRGETAGKRAESYLAAGYKVRRRWASVSASRLMQEPEVRRRIAELQAAWVTRPGARPPVVPSPFPTECKTNPGGDPMPALTNPKHEAFAQAFVAGDTAGNKAGSYLAAGYTCGPGAAKTCGARLAKTPAVMGRIAELEQERLAREREASERATARLALTKERVLAELARIAFANLLDYGRPDADGGFTVDLSRLDRDSAAAIQEMTVTPGAGKAKSRVRVRLAGKREALVDLGRHFGLFVPPGTQPGTDDFASLSDEEITARVRAAARELERMGVDVAAKFGIGQGADKPKDHLN